jgi:3-oxoacyl-[acyl-carrier protein] reductase
MTIDLTEKTALVTASSKGIGFGIASGLSAAGANVCICGRNEETLAEAGRRLEADDRLLAVPGDVSDPSFIEQLVNQCQERFGSIDILVNNSGGPPPGAALAITEEQWAAAINGNLLSAVRLSRLVVPAMKEKRWGRIVNLTSTAASEPSAGMVLSNVTRAGVAAFSKTLSLEVAEFGITVNTILTGGCLTDRLKELLNKSIATSGETFDEAIARIEKTIPVRHLATPEEFAQIVLFLASPAASYINGTAIPVDGGTSKSTY